MMVLFAKNIYLLTIISKGSITDIFQDSKYVFVRHLKNCANLLPLHQNKDHRMNQYIRIHARV